MTAATRFVAKHCWPSGTAIIGLEFGVAARVRLGYERRMDRELNILVVDDDVQILELIERVLSRNGMRVACAETTADADTKLESFDADLIVLDLMMAGEGGLDYCRRLRQTSRIPVIMLTALAEDIDRI
ncbi:MAG: response regulator, partial [Maricaulis sp.]|nr:response regulator [Maricaulis sp.]